MKEETVDQFGYILRRRDIFKPPSASLDMRPMYTRNACRSGSVFDSMASFSRIPQILRYRTAARNVWFHHYFYSTDDDGTHEWR